VGLKSSCLVVQSPDVSWLLVASAQGLTLEPILFTFFMSELNEGTGCILGMFASNNKLVGAVRTGEVRAIDEADLSSLEEWADT